MRKLIIIATALLAMLGLGVITAVPAQAATCTSGFICLWKGSNFTGEKKTISVGTGACVTFTDLWNNTISSAWNRSSSYYGLYRDANCSWSGGVFFLAPGDQLVVMSSDYDNKTSSISR